MASPVDSLKEKVWTFLQSLTPLELALGAAGALFTATSGGLGLWAIAKRSGYKEGRAFEVAYGQVPGLNLKNTELLQQNSDLVQKLDRRDEQISNLKQSRTLSASPSSELPSDLKDVLRLKDAVTQDDAQIWNLRKSKPLDHLRERLLASASKIITVGNLKGGVGKTTITANLAAYFAIKMRKRVLVIDLDYQGSVTAVLLRSAGKNLEFSQAEQVLSGKLDGRGVIETSVDLAPMLPGSRLVTAGYTLQSAEDQLMLRWLFQTTDNDVRFHLAELLLSPEVQKRFDVVLLDVGPRLTTASISALCASTHLIVPTNLDQLSVETVGSFLTQVQRIKRDFGLAIDLAGVVGTMTSRDVLNPYEEDARGQIEIALGNWPGTRHIFARTIPRTTALSNIAGTEIGYLTGGANSNVKTLFNSLGQEVAARIALN
jgi:cellulose biosynthesis protein BcsQ